jgi:hypothetical protein
MHFRLISYISSTSQHFEKGRRTTSQRNQLIQFQNRGLDPPMVVARGEKTFQDSDKTSPSSFDYISGVVMNTSFQLAYQFSSVRVWFRAIYSGFILSRGNARIRSGSKFRLVALFFHISVYSLLVFVLVGILGLVSLGRIFAPGVRIFSVRPRTLLTRHTNESCHMFRKLPQIGVLHNNNRCILLLLSDLLFTPL